MCSVAASFASEIKTINKLLFSFIFHYLNDEDENIFSREHEFYFFDSCCVDVITISSYCANHLSA